VPKNSEVFTAAPIYRAAGLTEWVDAVTILPNVDSSVQDDGLRIRGAFRMLTGSASLVDQADTKLMAGLPAALAHLPLTEDGIIQFAQEYGYLGVDQLFEIVEGSAEEGELGSGEQFNAWVEAVTVFRIIYRAIQGEGASNEPGERFVFECFLENPLNFAGHKYLPYVWEVVSDLCREPSVPSTYVPVLKARPDDLPVPLLAGELGLPIDLSWTGPNFALCEIVANYTSRLVGVVPTPDDEGRTTLNAVPRNLLGAAWLQLARDLETDQEVRYHTCPVCRRWYRTTRDDQTTCGRSSCRGRLHEERREQARALNDSGLSYSDIAIQMSDDSGERFTPERVEKLVKASVKRHKTQQGRSGAPTARAGREEGLS